MKYTTTIQQDVKEFMRGCVEAGDCTDSAGVISPTQLAEAACDEFDGWDENDDIPDFFFVWASEVVSEDDRELGAQRFAIGQSDSMCANQAQLDGWYEAAAASATVAIWTEESSIEDDYDWIRTGC